MRVSNARVVTRVTTPEYVRLQGESNALCRRDDGHELTPLGCQAESVPRWSRAPSRSIRTAGPCPCRVAWLGKVGEADPKPSDV